MIPPAPGVLHTIIEVEVTDVSPWSPRQWYVSEADVLPRIALRGHAQRYVPPEILEKDEEVMPVVVREADVVPCAWQTFSDNDAEEPGSESGGASKFACVHREDIVLAAQSKLTLGPRQRNLFQVVLASPSCPGHRFDSVYLHFIAIHYCSEGEHAGSGQLVRDVEVATVFTRTVLGHYYATFVSLFDKDSRRHGPENASSTERGLEYPADGGLSPEIQESLKHFVLNSEHIQRVREEIKAFEIEWHAATPHTPFLPTVDDSARAALGPPWSFLRHVVHAELGDYWAHHKHAYQETRLQEQRQAAVTLRAVEILHGLHLTQALVCAVTRSSPLLLTTRQFGRIAFTYPRSSAWWLRDDAAMSILVLCVYEYGKRTKTPTVPDSAFRDIFDALGRMMCAVREQSVLPEVAECMDCAQETVAQYCRAVRQLGRGTRMTSRAVLSVLIDEVLGSVLSHTQKDGQCSTSIRPVVSHVLEDAGSCAMQQYRSVFSSRQAQGSSDDASPSQRVQPCAHKARVVSHERPDEGVGSLPTLRGETSQFPSEREGPNAPQKPGIKARCSSPKPVTHSAPGASTVNAGAMDSVAVNSQTPGTVDKSVPLRIGLSSTDDKDKETRRTSASDDNVVIDVDKMEVETKGDAENARQLSRPKVIHRGCNSSVSKEVDAMWMDALRVDTGVFFLMAQRAGLTKLYEACSARSCHPRALGQDVFSTGFAILPLLASDCTLRESAVKYFEPAVRACTYAVLELYSMRFEHIRLGRCPWERGSAATTKTVCCKVSCKTLCHPRGPSSHTPCPCITCIHQMLASEEGLVVYDSSKDSYRGMYGTDQDFEQVRLRDNGISVVFNGEYPMDNGKVLVDDDACREKREDGFTRIMEPILNPDSVDGSKTKNTIRNGFDGTARPMRVTQAYIHRMCNRGLAWRCRYEMVCGYFDGALGHVLDAAESVREGRSSENGPPLHATEVSLVMTMPGTGPQYYDPTTTESESDVQYYAMASLPLDDSASCHQRQSIWKFYYVPLSSRRISKENSFPPESYFPASMQRADVPHGSVLLGRRDAIHRADVGNSRKQVYDLFSFTRNSNMNVWSQSDMDLIASFLMPKIGVSFSPRTAVPRCARPVVCTQPGEIGK